MQWHTGVQQPSLTFILGSATVYSSSSTYKVHCTSTTHDPLSNEEVCEKQAHKVQHASVLNSPALGTVRRSTGVRWSEAELGRGNISLGRIYLVEWLLHCAGHTSVEPRRPEGPQGPRTQAKQPHNNCLGSTWWQLYIRW